MEFPAPERSRVSDRRRWLAILVTLAAAVFTAMACAGNAAAAGNGANAWGDNEGATLGCGPSITRNNSFPAPVCGVSEVTAVSAGSDFGLALLGNGTVKSWGESSEGQLGNGVEEMGFAPQTVCAVGATAPCSTEKGNALTEVQAVSGGVEHALALLKTGKVLTWGSNSAGELGTGSTAETSDVPVEVKLAPETEKFKAVVIAAGGGHDLALMENTEKKETKVMAWGANEYGQLGKEGGEGKGPEKCGEKEAEAPCSRSPVEVTGLKGVAVTAISAGNNYSMALTSAGKIEGWGSEQAGELGNGVKHQECKSDEEKCFKEKVFSATPVEPKLEGKEKEEVEQISAGSEQVLVKLKSGGLKAWGVGDLGELGNGGEANSDTPVAVSGLTEKVAAIAGGANHDLALLNNTEKTVMAWGADGNGQLGVGTTEGPEKCGEAKAACSKTPIAVGDGLGQVAGISAGGEFSLSFGAPAPTVTEVKPKIGAEAGGAEVTITGTNFTGPAKLKFGTSEATEKEINAEGTSIKAKSPACKGTVNVTVTTPALISRTSEKDEFVCRAAGLNPTKWKSNGAALSTEKSPVFGLGTLTLENASDNNLPIGKVTCHTLVGGSLWNEGEAGLGSIEDFGTSPMSCTKEPNACPGAFMTAEPRIPEKPVEVERGTEKVLVGKRAKSSLPWHTEMNEVETEKVKSLVDKITKIGLTLVNPCSQPAPFEYEFEGTLEPKVLNGTKNGLSPTKLKFEGKGGHTGHLMGNVFAFEPSEKEAFLSGEVPVIGLGGKNELIQGQ
jgi:alpha-tubulin suppressor-like RCC1 family protein